MYPSRTYWMTSSPIWGCISPFRREVAMLSAKRWNGRKGCSSRVGNRRWAVVSEPSISPWTIVSSRGSLAGSTGPSPRSVKGSRRVRRASDIGSRSSAASRKGAVRVVRIVGRPMRPEPRPNHGRRDPHEDEAERFESEIREIAELGPGLRGRTGREKDHRRGPQNERCENFGFQATRSDVTRHFLRSRFIEDGVFPRFLVLPVHMEVGREEQRHDDPGHQEEARSSKEETGYGGEDQVGERAHREQDEEQADASPPSLETEGHGISHESRGSKAFRRKACGAAHGRSMIIETALPPPRQRVARPRLAPRSFIA